ncbi:MAG: hypothetical protein DWQ31_12135 [Planctomycetota bacterium]|nr:MAG: hypothetical protein DWQ31_12135 [Planctomycetota bacterium]REJ88030.1 MAG: hypothetical protein DWQ35_20485 [Planctomycetota bacterium]REK29974.1 MAG: hypothetical protein DWQ42_03380 [Planctomycetota bacterium]REK48012.1 MAG: hypothetical protein DWQ46_02980 [Planctomycetota bacterium]
MTQGIYLGPLAIPIPVSPYFQHALEKKAEFKERYGRAPILGPLSADTPDVGMDPPSDEQVWREFLRVKQAEGTYPFLHEFQFNDVQIVKDKITDYVDPPRVYPLIGPAQLHHVHYKCTVYYREKIRVGWPIPHTIRNEDGAEVIYIDKNHFHMVGNVDTGPGAKY